MSKEVGATLSAANITKALEKIFSKEEIEINNAQFACMDTTNVNSSKKSGLKRT